MRTQVYANWSPNKCQHKLLNQVGTSGNFRTGDQPCLQSEMIKVVWISLSLILKLLEPPIQDIHGNEKFITLNSTKWLHKIEKVFAHLQCQLLDTFLLSNIQHGKSQQIFNWDSYLCWEWWCPNTSQKHLTIICHSSRPQ